MTASWLIGVVLSCTSNLLAGLSNLAIRKSWLIHRKWLRYLGLAVLTAVNPVLDVSAMAFASPSILAPFSGLQLASVILLSKPLLREEPGTIRVLAACLIILGEVMVALFGDHSSHGGDELTLKEIHDSYWNEPVFLKYLFLAFLFECGIIYTMFFNANRYWKRLAWGVGGGFIVGFQNFIKDSLAVIHLSGGLDAVLHFWTLPGWFWVLLITGILLALAGLNIMADCYRRYDATFSAGSIAGSATVSASIMSALHYHTFDHLNEPSSYILYPLGLSILLVGVGLLIRHSTDANASIRTHNSDLDSGSDSDNLNPNSSDMNSNRGDLELNTSTADSNAVCVESLLSTRN